MITVICGTNRPSNSTRIFAEYIFKVLIDKQQDAQFLTLEKLPEDFIFNNSVFGVENLLLNQIVEQYISKAQKFIIISPEYNGGFPGVLKAFIDSFFPKEIQHKKAALVGIASGRAGNLRGMDQLTNVLHYLKVNVMPNKLPISRIGGLMEGEEIIDLETKKLINTLVDEFIVF